MSVYVIVAAGGQGTRMGGATPKQWLPLGGRSMLAHSVAACAAVPDVAGVIVVVPADRLATAEREVAPAACGKPWTLVAGGVRRQDSVAHGAGVLPADASVVLVHDAARPFVTTHVVRAVIEAARSDGAAIAAVPVHDTVKRVDGHDTLWCAETLPRDLIYLAQTPQGFRRDVFDAVVALGRDAPDATDEATLAERAGHRVRVVTGDPANIKITTAIDFEMATRRMAQGTTTGECVAKVRVGVGYDSHRFDQGRRLVLGGVQVPGVPGLAGHSDGDAVCHAVTDAVLGAAGLGDIGGLFPDTDPAWKDADSLALLRQAWQRVEAAGFRVGNIDIAVICQRPKIGPLSADVRVSLASVLGCPPEVISVKGKTPEGTPGLADALVVHVVALLEQA